MPKCSHARSANIDVMLACLFSGSVAASGLLPGVQRHQYIHLAVGRWSPLSLHQCVDRSQTGNKLHPQANSLAGEDCQTAKQRPSDNRRDCWEGFSTNHGAKSCVGSSKNFEKI